MPIDVNFGNSIYFVSFSFFFNQIIYRVDVEQFCYKTSHIRVVTRYVSVRVDQKRTTGIHWITHNVEKGVKLPKFQSHANKAYTYTRRKNPLHESPPKFTTEKKILLMLKQSERRLWRKDELWDMYFFGCRGGGRAHRHSASS
jgi:hypothetical protein